MRKVQFQLSEQLYDKANLRASESGFSTVDAYLAEIISGDLRDDPDDFDHLFTPAVVESLERASADARAGGKTYTPDEVREHFRKRLEAWQADCKS